MSGNNYIPDYLKDVGDNEAYIQTLLFGAKISDEPLKGGIDAITEGITSSHIAARIVFTDKKMYDKYVAGTDIPCEIYNKTLKDGKQITVYEVYASYGPERSDPLNPGATLDPKYLVNTINSGLLSPTAKDTIANAMGLNRTAEVRSHLPLLDLIPKKINLTTLSTIRYTPETRVAVQDFQKNILASDAAYRKNPTQANLDKHLQNIESQFKLLRDKIRPGMSMGQFTYEFNEKLGTIGLPERASFITKLGDDPATGNSLDLALGRVREVHDGLKNDQYNLILHNCAHFIKSIFTASTTNPEILAKFANDPLPGISVPVSVANSVMALQSDNQLAFPNNEIRPNLHHSFDAAMGGPDVSLPSRLGGGPEMYLKPRPLAFNYKTPKEDAALRNLARNVSDSNQFAIKTIFNNDNQTTFVFYDKNVEIARGFYDSDSKRNVFELPSPLNLQESNKLIKAIESNDPNAKIKINATADQMQEAKQLQDLLQKHFKDTEIVMQKPDAANKQKNKRSKMAPSDGGGEHP